MNYGYLIDEIIVKIYKNLLKKEWIFLNILFEYIINNIHIFKLSYFCIFNNSYFNIVIMYFIENT